MPLFGGKKAGKSEEKAEPGIVGFTKPKRFLFFKVRSKPVFGTGQQAAAPKPAAPVPPPKQAAAPQPPKAAVPQAAAAPQAAPRPAGPVKYSGPGRMQLYFMKVASRQKNLDDALKSLGIKAAPYEFVRKMFTYTVIICAVMAVTFAILLVNLGMGTASYMFAAALGIALYFALFNRFVKYPLDRSKVEGTRIERDILFAARDLVISMRSGMPLFNAMAAVSTGYGAASKEFSKIVELVQLGTPTEQAIDDVTSKSHSKTFKRIMLQASVSIRVGADVAGALQGVVDEVMQERIIELRRYGQRLNVLAMFYMLFGVIFPSMGIAVAAILTTFVNIFTITETTLAFALVGIFFLQIIFLNIMRSRPVFTM